MYAALMSTPGFTTIQKNGEFTESHHICMVNYENIKVVESAIEVFCNMQVIKRP